MKVLWIKVKNADGENFQSGRMYAAEDEAGQYVEDEFGCQWSLSEEGLKDFLNEGWDIEVEYVHN